MQRVILALDPFDPSTWEDCECEDVRAFLFERFEGKWPDTARIYHEQVATVCDVTPADQEQIDRLADMPGPFYVLVYPGDPITLIVAAVAAVAIAATVFLIASIPQATARNDQSTSPNNELAARTNKPRVNGRIPDIFGEVTSTPDLVAVPYKVFRDHREVEIAYMCVGRGEYAIGTVYDDETPVDQIDGVQVEIYGPNTSPNSGAPQLTIGDPITDTLVNISKSTAVNGQTLNAPNFKTVIGTDNIRMSGPGKIQVRDTSVFVWPTFFDVNDVVTITNGIVDAKNFNGVYTVAAVDNDYLTLVNPAAVNAAWATLGGAGVTSWFGPTIKDDHIVDIGPFFVDIPPGGYLIVNLVALSGLYKSDGKKQWAFDIDVTFDMTPVDAAGNPIGAMVSQGGVVRGSNSTRGTRASTTYLYPGFSGRAKIVAHRFTPADYDFDGTVVDEVKWRDLYVAAPITEPHFGNVTTVLAVTYATDGALALKERKLNLTVTRKVPVRTGPDTFGALTATKRADAIICAMCLDPVIGNRSIDEVDVDNIYDTVAEIVDYFQTEDAAQFCYTFDKDNLSFEETVTTVAGTIFSVAYRRGRVIKLSFERQTDASTLLFNHRNKLPGTEVRTVRFGYKDDIDGVEYTYVDRNDDAIVTKYLPEDKSAINPKKIESIGVRSYIQAHFHIHRAWNKLRWQNTTTDFGALQQAEMLVRNDRILVADNTRADTLDGEVLGQDGLELTLSQPFEIVGALDHVIFLQHTDGTTQAIELASVGAVSADDTTTVVLAEPPTLPLALQEDNLRVNTGYVIVGNDAPRSSAFLVAEREPQGNFTSTVTAINYDDRYYQNDLDFAETITADSTIASADIGTRTVDEG